MVGRWLRGGLLLGVLLGVSLVGTVGAQGPYSAQIQSALRAFVASPQTWTGLQNFSAIGVGITPLETANTVFQLKESGALAATGNGPLFLITENVSAPHDASPGVLSGTTFGLKFLNPSFAGTATTDGMGIAVNSDGSGFFWHKVVVGDVGYIAPFAFDSVISLTEDAPSTIFANYYFDAVLNVDHDALYATAHDFTSYINLASGKTLGTFNAGAIFDVSVSGAGTISDFYMLEANPLIDAATITAGRNLYLNAPTLSNGAAIGTWTTIEVQDLSTLTVSTAKNVINYGAGKFLVDSDGVVSTALFRSTAAKVLFRGTGTGATQLASTQTTPPTCSSNCGTSVPTQVGTDSDMVITMGSGGSPASGFVVSFNGTWAAAPTCTGAMAKTGMAVGKLPMVIVTTTGQLTVTTNGVAPATGDVYAFHCRGTQ